jgi:ribosome-associated translation inhibitor RaiA
MAVEIFTRLRQMKRAREQQGSEAENALILKEDQQAENFFNAFDKRVYKIKTTIQKHAFEWWV